jgi:hypothetical protein
VLEKVKYSLGKIFASSTKEGFDVANLLVDFFLNSEVKKKTVAGFCS